jgi:hypothetical protein
MVGYEWVGITLAEYWIELPPKAELDSGVGYAGLSPVSEAAVEPMVQSVGNPTMAAKFAELKNPGASDAE